MKLCDRCPGSLSCSLSYLGQACKKRRQQSCPEVVPNNAEILTNMDLDALANALLNLTYLSDPLNAGSIHWHTTQDVLDWLTEENEGTL